MQRKSAEDSAQLDELRTKKLVFKGDPKSLDKFEVIFEQTVELLKDDSSGRYILRICSRNMSVGKKVLIKLKSKLMFHTFY